MNLDYFAQRIAPILDHPATQFLVGWTQENKVVLWVLLALAIGFVTGRRRTTRTSTLRPSGEALVTSVVKSNFGPPDYHLMNHVTLQMTDGTTEVDHILVSRFGVFVIETKDYRGWIFADASQAKWTQVLFGHRFRFQNPIRQNFRHVRAVELLLDFLPPGVVKSVVLLTGSAEFKTEIPQGVFSLPHLIEYLREQTVEVMSTNRMQFCVGRLETARLAISGRTDVEHIQSLRRRHSASA